MMLLYTRDALLNTIRLPRAELIGTLYRILFGILYLLETKLQQNMSESTGEITGVCVDRYWILDVCNVGGYVPNVRPTRLPQFCENVRLGVCAEAGNAQVGDTG